MKTALFLVTLSALFLAIYSQSTWSTRGRQIMCNNQPFTVKGVNYAPIPPGIGPDAVIQWGDMFHRDWAHLHDRDIPLMRAAGVNSIRVYQLLLTYPDTDIDLDHTSFLDKLYNGGDRPIYLMVTVSMHANFDYYKVESDPGTGYCFKTKEPYNEWWCIDESKEEVNRAARQANLQHMVDVATKYGAHPAVMGFVVGNENNNAVTRENCRYWQWIDDVAKAVKRAAPGKLTSTTVVDDSMDTPTAAQRCNSLPNLDVWGINSYRGNTEYGFDNLFDSYSALSTKPLLITEFGSPGTTHNAQGEIVNMPQNAKGQADYLSSHWRDITAHASVCSGGYVFQWVDEWWKGNYWLELNPSPWAPNPGFPGGWGDEEGFGVMAVMPDCANINAYATRRDPVEPRAAYYVMGQLFGGFNTLPAETYADFDLITCRREFDPNPPKAPPTPVPTQPQTPTSAPPTDTPLTYTPDTPVHATPIGDRVPSSAPTTIITPQSLATPQFPNKIDQPSSASVVILPLSIILFVLALLL